MYSSKESTGTDQSIIVAAQKRSGSNFVAAIVDTTPYNAVQEPIGLHKSSASPLYPWNYSGKEHVSMEFGHSALATSPYAATMTRNAISWIQEGGKIVKETDPLYLEWLLASLHNIKLITLSRDMRASIASFKSNHLYEKWEYEDKMRHLVQTVHSTKILETLYGGLFPKDFAQQPEMRQLAFYYSLVVKEIERTTSPFNPLKIDYEDLSIEVNLRLDAY